MLRDPAFLSALGIVSPMGRGKRQVLESLMAAQSPGVVCRNDILVNGMPIYVGVVSGDLPEVPNKLAIYASRNLSMMIAAAEEIREDIDEVIKRYGRERIAVVMGTSTSGLDCGERAVANLGVGGELPPDYDFRQNEIGSSAEALAEYLELEGLAITISTACSSGAQALANGRRMLRTGFMHFRPCRKGGAIHLVVIATVP